MHIFGVFQIPVHDISWAVGASELLVEFLDFLCILTSEELEVSQVFLPLFSNLEVVIHHLEGLMLAIGEEGACVEEFITHTGELCDEEESEEPSGSWNDCCESREGSDEAVSDFGVEARVQVSSGGDSLFEAHLAAVWGFPEFGRELFEFVHGGKKVEFWG